MHHQRFETFPDFDFSNFGKYLERGLWPFLVTFVVSFLMVPIVWIMMIPAVLIGGVLSGGEGDARSCVGVLFMLVLIFAGVVLVVGIMLVLVPLKIRAAMTQDFGKSFNLGFVKRFVALTWKEMLLSSLFLIVANAVLVGAGMLVFCVGMYFSLVLVYFLWTHLNKQLRRRAASHTLRLCLVCRLRGRDPSERFRPRQLEG